VPARHFPDVSDAESFARVIGDDGALASGVAHVCSTLGVNARAERCATGSRPVYALGDELVLKLYAPFDTDEVEREATFLQALAGRLPIPTPALRAVGELDGWGYLLMSRLRGELLVTASSRIEPRALHLLAGKLGEALRVLHELRDPRLETPRRPWRALVEERRRTTLLLQEKRGLSPQWLEQLPQFLDEECPALLAANADSPLHTEVMREHLFVDDAQRGWRLTGLFDFEPSMLGPREYEFSAVGVFVACGDRALFREMLTGYGYRPSELDHAFERRILAHALLHQYSNLAWYLSRVPPAEGVRTLDQLASHLFGV
jgi:hygromycin-B 7''-O-kinase